MTKIIAVIVLLFICGKGKAQITAGDKEEVYEESFLFTFLQEYIENDETTKTDFDKKTAGEKVLLNMRLMDNIRHNGKTPGFGIKGTRYKSGGYVRLKVYVRLRAKDLFTEKGWELLKQGYDENTVWDFPVYSIELGDLSPTQYDYKPVDIVYHNLDQFNLFYISRGYSEQKDLTASKTFAGDNTQDIVFFLKNTATTCYEGPEIHEPRNIFPHYLQPYHRAGKLNYFSRLLSNMWLGAHGYCTGIRADFQVAVKVRMEVKNATVTSCKIPYISPAFVIPKLRDAAATSNTVDRVPQVPCPNLPYPAAVTDNNLKEANIKIKPKLCRI